DDRDVHRLLILAIVDITQLAHPPQHVGAPIGRVDRAVDRVVIGRRLRYSGQNRDVRYRELVERLAEVRARRLRDAVGLLAEEERVEEELEDLLLRELGFDADREDPLLEL